MGRKHSSQKPTPDEELPSFFVYDGRIYLGRYVRIDRAEFEAFDPVDRPLGSFSNLKDVIRAINAAGGQS